MRVWVDTDFGFDDLWALLLLNHLGIAVEGVSLVAGNVHLPQVIRNAEASKRAFDFDWPVYAGAEKPLQRKPESAARILGEFGMRSRGVFLPYSDTANACTIQEIPAIDAMANWLDEAGPHHIIALGPLTNLALLQRQYPEAEHKITQITWLGGSRGRGNHTKFAEYNALADPEALSMVAGGDVPLRMIDLELCRQVSFGESDIPTMHGRNQQLVSDLLGGYLDIALQRGRTAMSIYDPLAALAVADSTLFEFVPASLVVCTNTDSEYGRTVVGEIGKKRTAGFEIAAEIDAETVRQICLSALVAA